MKSNPVTCRRFLRATGPTALAMPFLESLTQAAGNPRTLDLLWAGLAELDRATPLETGVLKKWDNEGVVRRMIRYQVGVLKGAPSRVAAFNVCLSINRGGNRLDFGRSQSLTSSPRRAGSRASPGSG